jgi:hypothetical protein
MFTGICSNRSSRSTAIVYKNRAGNPALGMLEMCCRSRSQCDQQLRMPVPPWLGNSSFLVGRHSSWLVFIRVITSGSTTSFSETAEERTTTGTTYLPFNEAKRSRIAPSGEDPDMVEPRAPKLAKMAL